MSKFKISQITPQEWAELSENTHTVIFEEARSSLMDRIDYCLLGTQDGAPVGYITIKEMDAETCYWQHGGIVPERRNTPTSFEMYSEAIKWCFDGRYKRISYYAKSTNTAMLMFALKSGFKIVGTRLFGTDLYIDFLKEKEI